MIVVFPDVYFPAFWQKILQQKVLFSRQSSGINKIELTFA